MVEWTESAEKHLKAYLQKVRGQVEKTGADPDEVADDLMRHVQEEIGNLNLELVTESDVSRITARIGIPDTVSEASTRTSPSTTVSLLTTEDQKKTQTKTRKWPLGLLLIFGIIWPAAVIGLEQISGFCASIFFNPIPSWYHFALLCMVPTANFLGFWSLIAKPRPHPLLLGIVTGTALGISIYYTLLFLPLLPLSVLAIAYMGMGLLPLTPLISLIMTLWCKRLIIRQTSKKPRLDPAYFRRGIALGVALLFMFEIPTTITRAGMKMAATSSSSQSRLRAVTLLRWVGNRQDMLRMCYVRPGKATDILGFLFSLGDPVRPLAARKVYYQVTGIPFNAGPPPELPGTGRFEGPNPWSFDSGQGGTTVAGKVKDLALKSSRMDGSVDSLSALSYLEWTLVFKNQSQQQREARAVLRLPPGGVVSRLTLWINGEEREAAFAGRQKTRQAYQNIVQRRRDPVLVTTKGVGRVLVQCFPVPSGGEMKVRLGITSPLHLSSLKQAALGLPVFAERNFDIPESLGHHIWIESKTAIEADIDSVKLETAPDKAFALRGSIPDTVLTHGSTRLQFKRPARLTEAWSEDLDLESGRLIHQKIVRKPTSEPVKVVLVMDGSKGMKKYSAQIQAALNEIPKQMLTGMLIASDQVVDLSHLIGPNGRPHPKRLTHALKDIAFAGGCDNIAGLTEAWEKAAAHPDSRILWIHSDQPVLLGDIETLRQKWERRPGAHPIIDMPVFIGPNRIMEELDDLNGIRSAMGAGTLGQRISHFFDAHSNQAQQFQFQRSRIPMADKGQLTAEAQTSSHLARLWAWDRIRSHMDSNRDSKKALKLAMDYQLVTPVSGAVVLETEAQYKAADLNPAKPGSVPTIPEPETWMLIITVLCLLGWIALKKRKSCRTV